MGESGSENGRNHLSPTDPIGRKLFLFRVHFILIKLTGRAEVEDDIEVVEAAATPFVDNEEDGLWLWKLAR